MLRISRNSLARGTKRPNVVISSLIRYNSSSSSVSTPVSAEVLNQQAPNRVDTWAPNQRPRSEAQTGPRFEQKNLDAQPRPYAAIDLIAKQPVRYVHSSVAVCDGGRGAQGHPKIFINLDQPGSHTCGYCGLKYANEEFKAEIEASQS